MSVGLYPDETAAAGEVARNVIFDQIADYVDLGTIATESGSLIWRL